MIIDIHTHIMPPRVRNHRADYVARDACFAMLYSSPKAKLASVEELIASMDAAGVDASAVLNIGWTKHDLCVETNDYIMEAVSRYPKRLTGFCTVQPQAGDLALKELERCVRGGLKGIGELRPDTQGFDLCGRVMADVVALVRKNDLRINLHTDEPVGHLYPGKGHTTPDKLYPFVTTFPGVRVVFAHWGGGYPFYALMPDVAAALGNVCFDTAATSLLYRTQVFRQVIELVGADRVLYGSDFPLISQPKAIGDIRSLHLEPGQEKKILGENALRFLG